VSRRQPPLFHAAYDRFLEHPVDRSALRRSEEERSCRNRARTGDQKGACRGGVRGCGMHIGLLPILP
jgi:hypothetical protein